MSVTEIYHHLELVPHIHDHLMLFPQSISLAFPTFQMSTQTYSTPQLRWSAVSSRDVAAVGVFVYAVKTTGIYCRPGCPARLARRANVEFYNNLSLAEAAGYRACKRCKPNLSPDQNVDPIKEKIQHAVQLVRDAASRGEKISLAQLSTRVGLSKWHLQRVFKRIQGMTPREMSEAMVEEVEPQASGSSVSADAPPSPSSVTSQGTMTTTPSCHWSEQPAPGAAFYGCGYEESPIFTDTGIEDLLQDLFPELCQSQDRRIQAEYFEHVVE